jgi:hypothetical protein
MKMMANRRQHDRPIGLCYRPAVFFGHLLTRFFFFARKEEVGARLKNII